MKFIITMNLLMGIAVIGTTGACALDQKDNSMEQQELRVTVWDTYVKRADGTVMHFDILAPIAIKEIDTITDYGQDYLKSKGVIGAKLTSEECRRCHVETLRPDWAESITKKGYYIIEMEGCN